MKRLLAVSIISLAALSFEACALCLNITSRYSGTMAANSEIVAYGPFTINDANGCPNANITASVSAVGGGRSPKLYIERQLGSSWVQVAGDTGNNASYLGPLGTYRVRQENTEAMPVTYSGSTGYGR
ncbi:hypothetical protein [Pseudomonas sp. LP_7_YM]|uniref:hypothetical protein n=1 Tax=Pseudomonas sp. LP_7_YM TaxID=2485137 RepID=UPI00105E285D|nr:hypothetical protein [Pseudomonas sp. LP_7_YM]TDV63303.1 hypothetical protein EC915_10662 [Pseudomonas sp. LP_7_YM]